MTRERRRVRLGLLGAVVAALLPWSVFALTAVSEGYTSDSKLPLASIVSLKKGSTKDVELTTSDNVDNMLGAVIAPENSLLSLTNGSSTETQVATNGEIQVLVSDINGIVKRGDHITASPISGVGMKTTTNARVLGIAQGDVVDADTQKQTYKDSGGTERTVRITTVPVQINISYYFKEPDKTLVPSALQNVANSLAGKEVSTMPILISTAIFTVMIVVVVAIVYSLIRSSIISVGRNPMSQSAVYRGVIQISALVLAILGVGVIAIYLVLTRL